MTRSTVALLLSSTLALAAAASAGGQVPPPPPDQVAAMARLASWAGMWTGAGWTKIGPEGERRPFEVRESVASRLGGTVLFIEGRGTAAAGEGGEPVVVHDALAVLYWDPTAGGYRFQTHTALGRHAVTDLQLLEDGRMQWGFDTANGQVRFLITIEGDRWLETGEISPDGVDWFQFHEMELTRTSSD